MHFQRCSVQVGGDVQEAVKDYKRHDVRQKWEELESLSEAHFVTKTVKGCKVGIRMYKTIILDKEVTARLEAVASRLEAIACMSKTTNS